MPRPATVHESLDDAFAWLVVGVTLITHEGRQIEDRANRRLDELQDNLPWACPHHEGKLCNHRTCTTHCEHD